jgi:hypothetical protein
MVSFGDKIPGRERPWLRYDRISVENAPLAAPSPLSHDTGDTASGGQFDGYLRAQSPGFHRALFARDNAEARRKAHAHLSWWLPEIVAQVVGMLCLLGRFDTVS